jgi:hypothetical protein
MAKPVASTPVLQGKEAKQFIENIHADSHKKVGIVPTPKLDEVKALLSQYRNNEKHLH